MFINGKNIYEIRVFLDSNLNFAIRDFTWDLENDNHISKNMKNIFYLI